MKESSWVCKFFSSCSAPLCCKFFSSLSVIVVASPALSLPGKFFSFRSVIAEFKTKPSSATLSLLLTLLQFLMYHRYGVALVTFTLLHTTISSFSTSLPSSTQRCESSEARSRSSSPFPTPIALQRFPGPLHSSHSFNLGLPRSSHIISIPFSGLAALTRTQAPVSSLVMFKHLFTP